MNPLSQKSPQLYLKSRPLGPQAPIPPSIDVHAFSMDHDVQQMVGENPHEAAAAAGGRATGRQSGEIQSGKVPLNHTCRRRVLSARSHGHGAVTPL